MNEVWRPIVGHEEYEVSDAGRVRRGERIRRLSPNHAGYLTVDLWQSGEQTTRRVNRLVLEAFVGLAPEGAEACHRDGSRADNRLSNLVWGTHSENMRDRIGHGTDPNARKTTCPNGHAYDYVSPRGGRGCTECRRASVRAHRERQRSAA